MSPFGNKLKFDAISYTPAAPIPFNLYIINNFIYHI